MSHDRRINFFLNSSRRPRKHPLFDDIDNLKTHLSPDDFAQLAPYLDSNEGDVAAMARIMEDLVEHYPLLPSLVVRVADMRLSLHSAATAFDLYKTLLDGPANDIPEYHDWFDASLTPTVAKLERESIHTFNNSPAKGGQRWRSVQTPQLPGSHLTTPRSMFVRLKSRWKDMNDNEMLSKYCRYHIVSTNMIENTFVLSPTAVAKYVNKNLNDLCPADIEGSPRDAGTVLKILHDTDQALQDVISISQSDSIAITPEIVCRIHKTLMKTQRVLPNEDGGYTYTNIGITRAKSKMTATIQARGGAHVQFCPFWNIDEEFNNICQTFTKVLAEGLDPFAVAAWITNVFVSLHPFEDGNGRISRLLSSIPLLHAGLPLINIPIHKKAIYYQHLNAVRGSYDGDYRPLMDLLYGTMNESLEISEKL